MLVSVSIPHDTIDMKRVKYNLGWLGLNIMHSKHASGTMCKQFPLRGHLPRSFPFQYFLKFLYLYKYLNNLEV